MVRVSGDGRGDALTLREALDKCAPGGVIYVIAGHTEMISTFGPADDRPHFTWKPARSA
jgi:hypothetical protein